jgi:predicted transposase/invertase (TIGR01784 family)
MYLEEKYVNPFTDFGFKKLFGSEPNKDLLIDFLNQLLPPHHQIKDLTYGKSEFPGISELDRKVIFDLYCTSASGEKFIVEMQKAKQNFFKDRSVYYATFPIQEQGKRGDWDYKLAAVYFIGILDFVFAEGEHDSEVLHQIKLKDQNHRIFYDKLTFIYLEMPKFKKTEDELGTAFDKWLYVLKHLPKFQERPQKLREKVFEKLFESAQIARFNREELVQYEESLKVYRDWKNAMDTAIDTAFDKGVGEGEKKKASEVALKALQQSLPTSVIAELTGLSEEEIAKLKS